MDKDYLQRCEDSDIPDFATDGLQTSESFPSSFATDLQGLKQDCGMLATSFVENYSDVSSCSDADAGETRPSCKFMASNSFPKPKTDVPTKHSSSEWFYNDTDNMSFPTESLCPNMASPNVMLLSNVKGGEHVVECAQDKLETPENPVRAYTDHDKSSTTSYVVTSTESETVQDRNDNHGCPDHKQKHTVERDAPQGESSDISISGNENMTGDAIKYSDGNEEEQITSDAPHTITTVNKEQDHLDEKESMCNQENETFDNPNSTHGQDRNVSEDKPSKSELLKRERKGSGSLEKEISDEHQSPIPNSTNCQDENMETDCEEKQIQANPSPSDPSPSKSKDTIQELQDCLAEVSVCHLSDVTVTSPSESYSLPNGSSPDKNLCLEEEQSSAAGKDPDCSGPGDTSDSCSLDAADKNKQGVASHVESSLQTDSSSTDANTHLDKEVTSAAKATNTASSPDPDGSGPSVPGDSPLRDAAVHEQSCLPPNPSDADIHPCPEMEMTSPPENKTTTAPPDEDCSGPNVTSDSLSIDTSDKNKQSVANHPESCSPPDSLNSDLHPCQEKEGTSPTSSTDPERSGHAVTSDSVSNSFESCLQPESSTGIKVCSGKESTSPGENANTTSSSGEQQSSHKSPVAQEPPSPREEVADNARESFEELNSSTEEQPVLDMLYGEPLSREDSSCDADEVVTGECKETSVDRPDGDSEDQSNGRTPQLKSSTQMRHLLHPVVILDTLESTKEASDTYHCMDCQHTTDDVDHLVEHHHGCHSMCKFQFCKKCDVYLMSNEEAERHLCGSIRKRPRFSFSRLQKRDNRHGFHRCNICGLVFSKVLHYIKHMRTHTGKTPFKCNECGMYFAQSSTLRRHKRIPGRCKHSRHVVRNSGAVVSQAKTPRQSEVALSSPYPSMPKCYVKLVDIAKTNLCGACGESFSSAEKAKHHLYHAHKGKSVSDSSHQYTTIISTTPATGKKNKSGKYKCPLCPRLFKYSFNRARHLRYCVKDAIFGGKGKVCGKYQCPLCHATFTLTSNRYRHIKTTCFRECINRLSRENAKSRETVELPKTVEKEEKPQRKEEEQKTQAFLTSRPPGAVPRYRCSLCPAVFWHASGKYRHMKKHELSKLTGKMIKYRKSIFSIMSKQQTLSSTKTEESEDDSESDSRPTLSCQFCGKCFTSAPSLKKHLRNHRGERPYRCLECKKGFKKQSHLIAHKRVHQKRIQCTVCRKILPTVGELIQHRSSHLKKGMLQCPDCHQQFQFPAHLLRHLEGHRNRENKAHQLEERTPSKPQQSVESAKEPHLQCSLCKEVFSDAQVLRKHCLTHISGSSSHQCPFCKQNYNNRRYLLRHMIQHTGDKPFSCNNCGKQFYRNIYLKIHSQTCLPSQSQSSSAVESKPKTNRPYRCLYCPRRFCKKDRVKAHHRGHKAKSLLLCTRCGQYYGFTKLAQHQRDCGETTELNAGLSSPKDNLNKSTPQTSQKVHKMPLQPNAAKLLQFKCPHCPQRYRYRSILLRHIVSHTGLQPYPCMHCGQRFGSQTMCLQHEAFCEGDDKESLSKRKDDAAAKQPNLRPLKDAAQKPQAGGEAEYKCKFCTKTFVKPRSLRRHILTHNEVKPYRCKACDGCFSRYDHLRVHQVRCRGRKTRLEVCIPKISLDDVGRGWQSKFGLEPAEKKTFQCEVCSKIFPKQKKLARHFTLFHAVKLFKCSCGSAFSHEKSLKKHRKLNKCRKITNQTNAALPEGTNPSAGLRDQMRSRVLRRIQPHEKHKYLCTYCPRSFANSWQLGVHIRRHTGEKPFPCGYCGERFMRKDYVQRHYPKCTKKLQGKVLCDRCGGFFTESMLEKHRKGCISMANSSAATVESKESPSQSPPRGFSCAYCSSRFLLFSQLQEHFLSAHKVETVAPPASAVPLQQHLSDIPDTKEQALDEYFEEDLSDGGNVTCDIDEALDSEVPKSFFCSDCKISFANKAGLAGHLRTHADGHPFNCKTCNRGFWNKSLLRNHYRKCRNGHVTTQQLEAPLKAEIDLALNDSVLVFKEGSTTTGTGVLQTNFSCKEDTAEEPPKSSEGDEEQSSSSKEKKAVQYQCSECDMTFTDGLMLISHLEDHGRQEQEKKRNTCTKCGRVCSSQGNLEKHMRSHGVTKDYPCSHCTKMFYTLADLEAHKTCHDSNRPFSCKLCNQRFWTRPTLCSHYREEHVDDVFTCQFCSKAYAVKKSLSRHIRKWHQKEKRELQSTVPEKSSSEQQSSSQVSTTDENDDCEHNSTEGSDPDCAPYFPCHVCGKTFPTSESLEDHQLCHLGEKPHECEECGKCFVQAAQLQQHQRMHMIEFQCQTCGRGFVSLFALRKHKHTHGKSRAHRCSKCHLFFTGPSQLAEHMSTHREENFPCDICDRMFLSKSSRAEHRKSHSKPGDHPPPSASRVEHEQCASRSQSSFGFSAELKYRCGVCRERFRDPEELSEHGCMEARERPYSCADCDKHFLHASHLKKHRATHLSSWSKREYTCNQCNTSFSSSQRFLGHLQSHADIAAKIKCDSDGEDGASYSSFICPVCHRSFVSAVQLMDHFPTHPDGTSEFEKMGNKREKQQQQLTSATEYECPECGQTFLGGDAFCEHQCSRQQRPVIKTEYPDETQGPIYYPAAVEEEEVDVMGEDFYNCPVCSKWFSSKSGLLEHQNTEHGNDKPFKCELCGKAFAKKKYLKQHEGRHKMAAEKAVMLDEGKSKCPHCPAKFSKPQDLALHMRLHAEEEVGEYRCDMCYKSFSHWTQLKQHQESHVGEVVYECTECDKAFAFPHLLEEHQQTHAGSSQ